MDTNASTADIFARALHNTSPSASLSALSTSTPSSSSTTTTSLDANAHSAIGGFLVCLDVPPQTEFGVDYEVFRTGAKFQGVKFVPLGLHFVVFRAREQVHGIRQGFFVRVTHHAQVVVREWSALNEELSVPRPGLNIEHLEHAVRAFQLDSGLGAYPQQHHRRWRRLTKFISDAVLHRCGIALGALLVPGDSDLLSSSETNEPLDDSDKATIDGPRTVRFTPLRLQQRQPPVDQLSASERTLYHFDKSAMLDALLVQAFQNKWEELLGEFQLAFVVFLQLSSLAALEQWKQMIALLSSCDQALQTHPQLFAAFVKLLRVHLEQIPEDFFIDVTTSDNFLRPCLASLFELLEYADAPPLLRRRALELQRVISTRFSLDPLALVSDGDDEFAPVVVSEDELRMLEQRDEAALPQTSDDDSANAAIAAAFLSQQQH